MFGGNFRSGARFWIPPNGAPVAVSLADSAGVHARMHWAMNVVPQPTPRGTPLAAHGDLAPRRRDWPQDAKFGSFPGSGRGFQGTKGSELTRPVGECCGDQRGVLASRQHKALLRGEGLCEISDRRNKKLRRPNYLSPLR